MEQRQLASLRRYIRTFIEEGKVGASPEYMKKEQVRGELQAIIEKLVADGTLKTKEDLDSFFSSVDIASKALKLVPIEAFLKNSKRSAA
jgi:hypothetical protein